MVSIASTIACRMAGSPPCQSWARASVACQLGQRPLHGGERAVDLISRPTRRIHAVAPDLVAPRATIFLAARLEPCPSDVATTTPVDPHSGRGLYRSTGLILSARSTILARPIGVLPRRLNRRAGHRSRSPRASAAAGGIDPGGGEPGGPAEDPCRRGATGGPAYRPQCPRTGSARSCGRRASSSGPASPGR